MDTEQILTIAGIVASTLAGLYFVGAKLVDRLAANPVVDKWDEIKAKLDGITPYVDKVKKWADPSDPSVPPSPSNPTGTA